VAKPTTQLAIDDVVSRLLNLYLSLNHLSFVILLFDHNVAVLQ
jgi:hypothetical protein